MSTTGTPQPTKWHRKPVGKSGKACSICGYPAKRRGEHRATLPDEGHYRQWLHRSVVDGQIVETEIGNPHGSFKRIRDTTRENIAKAARMFARKGCLSRIAADLGVTVESLDNWRKHHPSIWKHDYHAELKVIEKESIDLSEPRPDRHAVVRSLPAVPAKAGDDGLTEAQRMPLLAFLLEVYVPTRIDLKPASVAQMEFSIRLLEEWAGQPLRIGDLSEDLIRRFLTDLRKSRAGSTVNSKCCHLKALWHCAYDEKIVDRLPRKIRRAKAEPTIPEAWSKEEVGRILYSSSQPRHPIAGIPAPDWWLALLLTIYDTGERRGAVFAVTPNDIDLDAAYIVYRRTKTGRPRWAGLWPETVEACRKIYDPDQEFMFPWPCSRESPEKRFRRILWRAKVQFGRGRGGLFHKLRRTSGTLVEAAGGDGARHLGNTRTVFEDHYLDPRFIQRHGLNLLPRPVMPKLLTYEEEGLEQ